MRQSKRNEKLVLHKSPGNLSSLLQRQQQQRPLGSSEQIWLRTALPFLYGPQSDTNLRCDYLGSGLVNRGNVPVVVVAQSCFSFSRTSRWVARLRRPRAQCVNSLLIGITLWQIQPIGLPLVRQATKMLVSCRKEMAQAWAWKSCEARCTRSSPQLWSDRSTTAHIVFDRRSLTWGFDESCTIVQGTKKKPENAIPNVFCWHFRRTPTVWL